MHPAQAESMLTRGYTNSKPVDVRGTAALHLPCREGQRWRVAGGGDEDLHIRGTSNNLHGRCLRIGSLNLWTVEEHLELYIKSLEAQGSPESAGSFTLAVEKARERFLTFQQQSPAYYLLRIFQAAVASGTPELHVTFGRTELNLWFVGNLEAFSPEKVQAALVDPNSWDDSPLGHLAIGLLCALSAASKIVWVQSVNQQVTGLVLSDTESQVAPAVLSHRPLSSDSDFFLLRVQKTEAWIALTSATAQEHSEATIRFQHAPMLVELDSRPLKYEALPCKADWFDGFTPPRILCQAWLGQKMPWCAHFTEVESDLWINRRPDTKPLVQMSVPLCSGVGELRLPVALEGPDVVILIKHGLTLGKVVLKEKGLGAEFILHCNLPTDLSGLAVRESSELQALKLELEVLLQTVRCRILTHLNRLEIVAISALGQTGETAKGLATVAAWGGELGLLAIPFIALGSVGVYAKNVAKRWNLGDLKEHLLREIGRRLQVPTGESTAANTSTSVV